MQVELVLRFLLGGLIVSGFAVLGDALRPKTFAGLFGAAPSVALATLGIAFVTHDGSYVATEARAMIAGAVALGVYSLVVAYLLLRRGAVGAAAVGGLAVWFGIALSGWALALR